jgi:hypothetical protein
MAAPDENQFKELREDIREGFKNINSRIDNLVTRNEFAAELKRIDEKHEHHVNATSKNFDEVGVQLSSNSNTTKWAIGITVTVVALVFTIVNVFLP